MTIDENILRQVPAMTDWRHFLHAHPETAFNEHQTSDFVAARLASFGIGVHRGLGKTGVVGTLQKGRRPGRTIGLRADMDALDITEENTLSYGSGTPGKMHACGHDGHTAMLLGAAQHLAEYGTFEGTVHFLFQPAEENEGGGRAMIDDGLFELFPCDAVFGLHNFPGLPFGCFALRPGPMMAAYDVFTVRIQGTGGHAAMPHRLKDPVLAAAHLIGMFQGIVSRNVDPVESAVVSVTRMNGGTNFNIVPTAVTLHGTTRHFQAPIQDLVEARMKEIVAGVSLAMGVDGEILYERRYPALINHEEETALAARAATRVAGEQQVMTNLPLLMGSEDFAFMLQRRPGAYIGLGVGDPRPNGLLHQPSYDFNDELLPVGAAYWVSLAEDFLSGTP